MFSREFGRGPNGPIEYKILLTDDDKIEEALGVQQKSMEREMVALGVGIYQEEGAAEAMKILFRRVIEERCTIIALDSIENRVVGVAFNKLHIPPSGEETTVERGSKPRGASLALVNFLDYVESRVNLFERYETEAAMEIFYIGTAPEYRGWKIGHGLVERSVRLARSFGARPPGVIFGVFTSNYSQRIAARLNFEWLAVVRYDEYECDGRKMSERIGSAEHQTAKLGALELSPPRKTD